MLAKDKSPQRISSLFDGIAPFYDRANSFLSLNLHKGWNRRLARLLKAYLPSRSHVLDLCAGTGAISKELLLQPEIENVTLLDVSPGMLALARTSVKDPRAHFIEGDALHLPFDDHHFDAVTVAYGIRNLPCLEEAFQEVRRVLKPGGTFAILELTRPKGWFAPFHTLYLKGWVPLIGKLVSGHGEAYSYLSSSVASFVPTEKIEQELELAGFHLLKVQPLFKGCATLFFAS